jgi:hypothetical protein
MTVDLTKEQIAYIQAVLLNSDQTIIAPGGTAEEATMVGEIELRLEIAIRSWAGAMRIIQKALTPSS